MERFHLANMAEPRTAQLCGCCSKNRLKLKAGSPCVINARRELI